jgi:hypothetical protein
MISEEQEARAKRPGRLLAAAVAAAAVGKEKATASPGAIRLPLQVDSPAISALPTSHQCSPPPLVVAGAGVGAGLGFSAVGLGWVGALVGGVDSVRILEGLTGSWEEDGDGVGVGGGLWSKSRRMLMALVGSSPAMWSARMISISAVPSPSTARTMATCSSRCRSFPISAGVAALPTPAREIFPQTPARFAPLPMAFAGRISCLFISFFILLRCFRVYRYLEVFKIFLF